jgi:hypothetical protein
VISVACSLSLSLVLLCSRGSVTSKRITGREENVECGLLFRENRSVVEGLNERELAEGHVMSVGAVEGLKGRELVECHVIMSSVASAIPTSNHKKNECGLSVL